MNVTGLWTKIGNELADDPLLVTALLAALVAIATTPLAFAVLGRMEWFKARRGRVMQRPGFAAVVAAMVLVMMIPAIFAALVLKSRSFDKNRYEYDPNRTWSVLEQGRGFKSLEEADAAVKNEMERLAVERKNLVDNVKKLDQAMLALRASATSAQVAQAFPAVLQSLAGVRKSVGVDGPQQLIDATALPVELQNALAAAGRGPGTVVVASPAQAGAVATSPTPAPAGSGLTPAQLQAELSAVPEPQKGIVAMLPLTGLPAEWTVGKSGDRYTETFNAENLYEKIDGRAESFLQYDVKGMAYTFYHPTGDSADELQLYIYEMANPLKALGKYGSEKPDDAKVIPVGDEGYTAAGSTLFYAGKYYNQIVSTKDDPKFAAFAVELAKRVAAQQKPGAASAAPSVSTRSAPATPEGEGKSAADAVKPAAAKPAASGAVTPATYFAMLPAGNKQGGDKYVAQDVFGYSFLSDVFMADYKEKEVTWQGFLRPYKDDKEAKDMLAKYRESVKLDGAELKPLEAEGADEMVVSSNIGLFDVIFRKGNTLAGANGATSLKPAEAFARALAKTLPARVPLMGGGSK
ncbi:MAG: DUF6599 family protein [Isosphaeraceae bacterium]